MEWYRFITIGMALIAIVVWIYFFYHYREPVVVAPISWLLNVIAYIIFKIYAGSNPLYYSASITWSTIVLTHGILLLITAAIIFKDAKQWTYHL
jgi:hypothetical protein